ncbi:MAG: carbohydrate ABC transporter permease, partial [Clostridia bacterium]|nr:carbohydrate ABC transporter permease [Clostridia bacterium]
SAQVILHAVIALLMFMTLYPLFIAVFIGLKSHDAFLHTPWLPTLPLWFSNFKTAFEVVGVYMFNTLIVGTASVLGTLALASLSAYVFSRMRFPGRQFLYFAVIALMMVPGVLTLVPSYMLYNNLGLLNSYWVLIIPNIFGSSVGAIFLFRTFFDGLPESIFEAARIDGCTEMRCYFNICLPLSKAILGTQAISQIIGIWNDVVWPSITITDPDMWTISAGLYRQFAGQYSSNTPVQFAGYILASLPLILLFVFANRYYIEGLTTAGLKL